MSAEHHQTCTSGGTVTPFTALRRTSEHPATASPSRLLASTAAASAATSAGGMSAAGVSARFTGASAGTFTATQLRAQAAQAASALSRMGVGVDDRVAVLLPMSAESVIATLACVELDALRITLPLDGDPTMELRGRLVESSVRVVVTADACERHGVVLPLKSRIDRALATVDGVRHVLVVRHLPRPVPWTPGRDRWWHEALRAVA